jgi:hypothetical protein
MTAKIKSEIKGFFETGDKPTEAQFIDFIDSYVDKNGPIGVIETAASAGGTGAAVFAGGVGSIASYSSLRTLLGIEVFTSAQSDDIARAAIDNVFPTATSGAIEKTGANTYGVYTVSDFAKTVLDDDNAATARTTLGTIAEQGALRLLARTTITPTTSTNTIPSDDTIPQNTEGDQVWTQAVTPPSSSHRILIQGAVNVGIVATGSFCVALFRSGQADAIWATSVLIPGGGSTSSLSLAINVDDAPATGSSVTYSIRVGKTEASSGTIRWGDSDTARFGAAMNGSNINIYTYLP